MENSPPGSQTIPSGAGVGAGGWLGMVGVNTATVASSVLFWFCERETEPGRQENLLAASAATMTAAATHTHRALLRKAGDRFGVTGWFTVVVGFGWRAM